MKTRFKLFFTLTKNYTILLLLLLKIPSSSGQLSDTTSNSLLYLKNLLKQDPHNPSLLTNIGYWHWLYNDVDMAEKYLSQASKINNSLPEPLFYLGMLQWYKGELENSLQLLSRACRLDTLNHEFEARFAFISSISNADNHNKNASKIFSKLDTLRNKSKTVDLYSSLYRAKLDPQKAKKILVPLLKEPGCEAIARLALGNNLMASHVFADGCNLIISGLEAIKTNEDMKFIPEGFEWILSDKEQQQLKELNPRGKGQFFSNYWRKADPTPGTPLNERLVEHFKRIDTIHKQFNVSASTISDDRAKIHVRFGEPDERYVSVSTTFSKPNESWIYFSKYQNLCFDFVEMAPGIYRLVPDLSYAVMIPENYDMYRFDSDFQRSIQELYNERSHLGGHYSQIAMEEIGPENMIQQVHQFMAPYDRVRELAPPTLYDFVSDKKPFDFPFRTATFKDQGDKTLLEIYFGLPKSGLHFFTDVDSLEKSEVDFAVFISDLASRPLSKVNKRLVVLREGSYHLDKEIHLERWQFRIPGGKYLISLNAEPLNSQKSGVYADTLEVPNYEKNRPQISDIQLSLSIQSSKAFGKFTNKWGLSVIPYPFYQIVRSEPIFCFFEIYGLAGNPSGMTSYEMTYKVQARHIFKENPFQKLISRKKDKISISASEVRNGSTSDDFAYFSLDFKNLSSGPYSLEIQIKDLISGKEARSKTDLYLKQ